MALTVRCPVISIVREFCLFSVPAPPLGGASRRAAGFFAFRSPGSALEAGLLARSSAFGSPASRAEPGLPALALCHPPALPIAAALTVPEVKDRDELRTHSPARPPRPADRRVRRVDRPAPVGGAPGLPRPRRPVRPRLLRPARVPHPAQRPAQRREGLPAAVAGVPRRRRPRRSQ